VVSDILKKHDAFIFESQGIQRQNSDPEEEGTTFIQDMAKNLPNNILSHSTKPESSRQKLLQTVISQD
jgi:hypothetical protein